MKSLMLLIIVLGLGIPCASATNVSLNPQTIELHPDSSQDVQLLIDSVPMGLSGFKISFSVSDPTIAQISEVSFPNWETLHSNSTLPLGSVWIKGADLSNQVLPGNTNVLLANITITGKKAGSADLNILPVKISDDNGTSINQAVIKGKVHVSSNNLPIRPVANFSSNVNSGYAPLSVKFTDLSTNVKGWKWNFGDGSSSKQQNPTHVYKTAGIYTVTLTVRNKNGTDSKQAKINVSIRPPEASFKASRTSGYHPLTVYFTDTSKGTVSSRKWDFGDGQTSTKDWVVHTYTRRGTYTCNLTVENSGGSSTASKTITVR